MKLSSRRLKILSGETYIPEDLKIKYLKQWELDGYDISSYRYLLETKEKSSNEDFIFNLSVHIKTCARAVSYLSETVRSVNYTANIRIHEFQQDGNTTRSFRKMLIESLKDDSEWFLFLEDDCLLQRNAIEHCRSIRNKNAIYSLYTNSFNILEETGWHEVSGILAGSLALLMHRDTASRIALSDWAEPTRVDAWMSNFCSKENMQLFQHSPSLAEHIGKESALWPGKEINDKRVAKFLYEPRIEPVTIITPTGDRQLAFSLLEKYINNQTFSGEIQWIVVDDGIEDTICTLGQEVLRLEKIDVHSLSRNLREAIKIVKHKKILIMEDDDYYGPDYISVMAGKLDHHDMVGQTFSRLYYLRDQRYRVGNHTKHVSLCRTGFTSSVLDRFKRACLSDHPSVDLRFWEGVQDSGKFMARNFTGCISIKQMPGRKSPTHLLGGPNLPPKGGLDILESWIGQDVDNYKGIAMEEELPPITQQAVNFAKDTIAHAANGFKKVDAKTKEDRIAICRSCPHFRPQGERCGKCGCYIHSKANRASSSCPIGSW